MGLISWLSGLIRRKEAPETVPEAYRPVKWAKRVGGINNAFCVADGVLFRSAQPESSDIQRIKDLGIRTIVSLRTTMGDAGLVKPGHEVIHKVDDEDAPINDRAISDVEASGLRLVHLWFHPLFPAESQVTEFIKIVSGKENQPVLVHCRHGSDRTGTMCAAYRIVVQGWTKQDAIDEMESGGYGFHYKYFQNLVAFLTTMSVGSIRKDAGLGA
jgi:protein tyrosine/serine phosphatase